MTKEYYSIVKDILENDEFNKLRYIEHHGSTRYEHCMRVSYISYKAAKKLHLNYMEMARAGLLHDFFLSDELRTFKEKFLSVFTHPSVALKTSNDNFDLTIREQNIIASHMFPLGTTIPKYSESVLIAVVDKFVAVSELGRKLTTKLKIVQNVMILMLFSIFK